MTGQKLTFCFYKHKPHYHYNQGYITINQPDHIVLKIIMRCASVCSKILLNATPHEHRPNANRALNQIGTERFESAFSMAMTFPTHSETVCGVPLNCLISKNSDQIQCSVILTDCSDLQISVLLKLS